MSAFLRCLCRCGRTELFESGPDHVDGALFAAAEAKGWRFDRDHAVCASCRVSDCNCNPLAQTGGGHAYSCPALEPECTCYELTGGHQPGCYFNRNPTTHRPEL